MFDVILVTHKDMMTISGTHIQGVQSTQVRHHTQIDLLTFRVCFVKHMIISTQVRHYTHFDLSTCRPFCWTYDDHASVLPPTLVRSLPIVCAWSRSLSFFSALVCDLLPRRLFHGFAKGAWPEEYLSHNFDEHCLEDNRLIWCVSYPSGGAPLIPGHLDSW